MYKLRLVLGVIVSMCIICSCDKMVCDASLFSFDQKLQKVGTQNLSIEDIITSVFDGSVEYRDLLNYPVVQNEITNKISRLLGKNIDWAQLSIYVSENPRLEQYPYIVLLPQNDLYQNMLQLGIAVYKVESDTEYELISDNIKELYGRYTLGDEIVLTSEMKCVNKTEINQLLEQYIDIESYLIKYRGINIYDGNIFIPIFNQTVPYVVRLLINADYSYSFLNIERIYPETLTFYDFYITYSCLGLTPMELVEYDLDIPVSPSHILKKNEMIEYSDIKNIEIFSEFLPYSFMRIKSEEQDDIYLLTDRMKDIPINIADIPMDASYDRYYWKIQE